MTRDRGSRLAVLWKAYCAVGCATGLAGCLVLGTWDVSTDLRLLRRPGAAKRRIVAKLRSILGTDLCTYAYSVEGIPLPD